MQVEILFKDSGSYFSFKDVIAAFQEDKLFCIQMPNCIVKYPIAHIFRIKEMGHREEIEE